LGPIERRSAQNVLSETDTCGKRLDTKTEMTICTISLKDDDRPGSDVLWYLECQRHDKLESSPSIVFRRPIAAGRGQQIATELGFVIIFVGRDMDETPHASMDILRLLDGTHK
jgi:hypothetical protein